MTLERGSANPKSPPLNLTQLIREDGQLLQIVDAALADAARRAGPHLACRPGCTPCCHGAFAITALDARRLRTAMISLSENAPEQAAAIALRAQQYVAEFGPEFPGDKGTGILGTSQQDTEAFDDFANDAACPALNPQSGLCDLYAARPIACRTFGPPVRIGAEAASAEEKEFAVCELCFTQATPEEVAAAEIIVPWTQEASLVQKVGPAETIIAYCLTLPPQSAPAEPS